MSKIIYSDQIETRFSFPTNGHMECFQIEEDSFWFKFRNRVILHFVRKYHTKGSFFDIGGGNGFVSKSLQSEIDQTWLIEPGPEAVQNAKKRGVRNIVCGNLEEIELKANSINSSGLFDVLEHVENDLDFLKFINEHTAPGGHIFLTVPAFQFLWSYQDVHAGHFRRYTKRSLAKVLQMSGFEPVQHTYFFSALVFPIFLLRTLRFSVQGQPSQNSESRRHSLKNPIVAGFVTLVFQFEFQLIKRIGVPFGSSLFFVARKPFQHNAAID